ncbi:MAG: hypothetical protein HOL98_07085 [Gammaproteobacteria bacterium]|nr:hypothetical protein [Gammaproteobacteria bacterium]MBT5203202.1 hypothetical protein [Gammaproteobacteria bacterium]MBT5603705.1 hypothetical protein [Gammaproteobacteria bacterium]MBT6247274.1 hypothetical protein [Gammaproteobacteria bacterium]
MNLFDSIVEKEKRTTYTHKNKDLLSFYVLTLVAQQQAARKLKRNLLILLMLFLVSLSLLLSPLTAVLHTMMTNLASLSLIDILEAVIIGYGLVFALFTILRGESRSGLV